MSRMVGTTTARLWLALAFVLGGPAALVLATTVETSSAPLLAAVAVAALTAMVGPHRLVATAVPRAVAPRSGAPDEPASFLASRVTDPLHHPLRPRAPGLA
jgi:hypothetical protein